MKNVVLEVANGANFGAVANCGEAMERKTLENGRSSASLNGRGNFLRKACFALLAVYLFSTADVFSQQQKGDFAAGLNIGLVHPGIGGKFQYVLAEKWRLQGDFAIYVPTEVDSSFDGDYKIKKWGADVNAHYMLSEKKVKPYLVFGLGWVNRKASIPDPSVDIGSLPAANFGGGIDIGIGNNLALNFEIKIRLIALLQAGFVYRF